ncbi:patatin-like phospholipase family protein [Clostridium sp.]|uniref:patatin-like phospholipase family protein n=1 Tax=Clostridium sp. TaxID=1506 RepID=UPI00261536BF|nr:patatin-like phospholipase family protein [Clostridium sp.]
MKIGLVLGGGGGKGAYELGVWKALSELGISKYIKFFSGTSIGAFNAVLFAQEDIEVAENLWKEVSLDKLIPLNKLEILKKGIGLIIGGRNINLSKKYLSQKSEESYVTKEGAIELIDKYVDIRKIKSLGKVCYATCTEFPSFKVKYFNLLEYNEEISKDIIIASSSLPLIYEPTEINNIKYIDGAICDNLPIQPLYGEGCNIIIVVSLSKENRVNRSLYPKTKIIEIYSKSLNENIINGTLNLDEEAKKNRIKEGYLDAMNILLPIIEMTQYIIQVDEKEKNPFLYKVYKGIAKK